MIAGIPLRHVSAWILWRALTAFLLVVVVGSAAEVNVRVLCTTDIHGVVESPDRAEDGGGGWLRLASLIHEQRAEAGEANTLLVDCGDTVQGTLVARLSAGQVAIDLLKHLDYDVWIPGNHEFDFGLARFREMAHDVGDRLLCANLRVREGEGWRGYRGWRIITRGGARIAVVGMTASYMGNWFWGPGYEGFMPQSAKARLEEELPAIHRQKPDAIILAMHQGWLPTDQRSANEVAAIAERFPEIDLILGGHTHWDHAGRRIGPRTWYVQAGRHGDCLAVIDVRVDTDAHRVVQIESRLVAADARVEPNAAAAAIAEPWLRKARDLAEKPIGLAAHGLSAEGQLGVSCETSELLSAAIAEATGAVVVLHGRLSTYSVGRGQITEGDLFSLVPYENSLGLALLTERQLAAIIEEQVAKADTYVACGLYGIVATIDAEGRVSAMTTRDGNPLTEPIRVAFNSYTLAGGGGRFPVLRRLVRQEDVRVRDSGIQTHDAVRDYLKKHRPLQLKTRAWLQFTTHH